MEMARSDYFLKQDQVPTSTSRTPCNGLLVLLGGHSMKIAIRYGWIDGIGIER